VVVKTLYEAELGALTKAEAEERIRRKLRLAEARDFALTLISLVLDNLAKIDSIVACAVENWEISRMTVVDRNTLRLGTAEIVFGDVPPRVAINEAIEIAKKYSTENSGGFVNGILDRVAGTQREVRDNL
jgi:N utilization substance protein B